MRMGKYVEYTDGQMIFEEGSAGKEVYFIVSGKAEVSQRIDGGRTVIATLGKGDFFGEMAPLIGDVRSMTITAIGSIYLWELSIDEMLQYMQNNPEIMKDVYVRLAKRLRDTDLLVRDLALRTGASSKENHRAAYIARTGVDVYHEAGCRYLGERKIAIEEGEAIKQGYRPCNICSP